MVDQVVEFERTVEEFIGVEYAVAVCNGTAALHTALLSCGIGPGDEVVTTPFTFIATTDSILNCGAKPIFADIDPISQCLDVKLVEKVVEENSNIRAILGVDLFGRLNGVTDLSRIAGEYDLLYIEDASQAFGATAKNRFAGTFGDVGTFSFYASKNLHCFEGGMLVTDCEELAKMAKMIRNHGMDEEGNKVTVGWNYKMSRMLAFIGDTNLRLHKPGILAELGRYSILDGYYPRVVYDNDLYRRLGVTGSCPVAERLATKIRMMRK